MRLVNLEDVKRYMGCECRYYGADKKEIVPETAAAIYRALCPKDKTRGEMWPAVVGRVDDDELVVEMVGADGNVGFKFYYGDIEPGQSPLDPQPADKAGAGS